MKSKRWFRFFNRWNILFIRGIDLARSVLIATTSDATGHDAVGTGVFARKVSAATLSYRFSADSRPTCIHPLSLYPLRVCRNIIIIIIIGMGEDRFKFPRNYLNVIITTYLCEFRSSTLFRIIKTGSRAVLFN